MDDTKVIDRLRELRLKYDPNSDEYADISQTIFYLKTDGEK